MKIWNEQGVRPIVVDAVAPFLEDIKALLPLFEDPDVFVGEGAMIASVHLSSNDRGLPGEAIEAISAAARRRDLSCRVTSDYAYGQDSGGHRILVNVYGFLVF